MKMDFTKYIRPEEMSQPTQEWLPEFIVRHGLNGDWSKEYYDGQSAHEYLNDYLTRKFGSPDEWVRKSEVAEALYGTEANKPSLTSLGITPELLDGEASPPANG